MIKAIKIGTKVKIHNNDIELTITNIKIGHNNSIQYLVCGLNENQSYCEWWIIPDEITSKHIEETIINQCLR